MWQGVNISIRRFEKHDIPKKVEWINDPANNRYLHYDLPLRVDKTEEWFDRNRDRTDRFDAVIEADGVPIGVVGLLSIDRKNGKAEHYITIGEAAYRGRGISRDASRLVIEYGFEELGLNRIYFYTETGNAVVHHVYESLGFQREGCLRGDLFSNGQYIDRYVYGLMREDWSASHGA